WSSSPVHCCGIVGCACSPPRSRRAFSDSYLVFLNRIAPVMAAGVCETLKLDPITNLLPILMIAGDVESSPANSNFHIRPNVCLSEPYTIDQLHQAAQEALTWR